MNKKTPLNYENIFSEENISRIVDEINDEYFNEPVYNKKDIFRRLKKGEDIENINIDYGLHHMTINNLQEEFNRNHIQYDGKYYKFMGKKHKELIKDFLMEIPRGYVYNFKTNRILKLSNVSNQYIENNKEFIIVNPMDFQEESREVEEKKEEKEEKEIEEEIKNVIVIKKPNLSKMRDNLKKFKGEFVTVKYILNGKVIKSEDYYVKDAGFSKQWKSISLAWMAGTDYDIDPAGDLLIYKQSEILTDDIIIQRFRDGLTNCLLTPIKKWIIEKIDNSKSKNTKKKYKKKLLTINEMMEKYKNGVPEEDIDDICNYLQIDINIEMPLNTNRIIECKSSSKPLRKFRYINTRLNHVENTLVTNDNIQRVEQSFIDKKIEELNKKGEYYVYTRNGHKINSIKTLNEFYSLEDDYTLTKDKFEIDNGLTYCKIDDIKQKELSEFICEGTHYNQTVDFVNVYEEIQEEFGIIGDTDSKLVLDWRDYIHIDMEKAYANYRKCFLYEGFLGKITDFRKTNKIEGVGIYQIDNLDFSNCNQKFLKYNNKLKIYKNKGVYPSPELRLLNKMNVKYEIKGGCWGVKPLDFNIEGDMLTKKNDDGIKYYCMWAGKCDSHRLHKKFRVKGDKDFALLLKSKCDEDTKIYYDEKYDEIIVTYKKKSNKHLGHITAFLTSYQRISTIEQLLELDYDNIIRVCVDGIYFKKQEYTLKNVFRTDKKGTFGNFECDSYISDYNVLKNIDFNDEREHYSKELHIGQGGCGKTHINLTDKGLVSPLFCSPSWKLAISKEQEYGIVSSVWAILVTSDIEKQNEIKNYNVLIIDEVSMMTEECKQFIFNTYGDMKIIMCGDIGYQLGPIEGECMNKSGFDNIREYGESKRFKCNELKNLCNTLRHFIENNKDKSYVNKYVNDYFMKRNRLISEDKIDYNINDMILTGVNKNKDYFTDKYSKNFGEINKYYVLKRNRKYQRGCIVIGKKPDVDCEVRHSFTVHSIQGETATSKLYIDNSKMFDVRMFYTAISRAKELKQITIIKKSNNMKKYLKK